jgi:hypothetical protein
MCTRTAPADRDASARLWGPSALSRNARAVSVSFSSTLVNAAKFSTASGRIAVIVAMTAS